MTSNLRRALFALALSAAAGPVLAGPGDGMVVSVTKIVDNGPAADRFNLVLISDGYQASELATFATQAQDFADFLFNTPPFDTNCSAINVWRIDVASNQSGADDPAACVGGTGATANTYFDATFCGDGVIRRLLTANGGTAIAVLNAQIPEWDQAPIVVNSTTYGGSGGGVGVTSISGTWENIAVHEFGHSAFGLADEYEYWAGCSESGHDNHPAGEPVQPNVTMETDPTLIKWKDLILGTTPVPTTVNADCTMCDPQGNPYSGQVVGLYEGAHYYHCDAYRPVFHCMMRNFAPFCPVCTKRILDTLAPFQPPNSAPACHAGGPYVRECAGATTSAALDGSASADHDCDPLSFLWTGPFTGGSASGSTPTVQFPGTGAFNVALQVGDGTASSSCNATVTVQDTLAPSIVAPPDVNNAECVSSGGVAVALGTPTVGDICDATVSVANNAPAVFPIGTTNVTWTAEDDAGHVGTDTQSVTVVDTTPPVLTLSVSPTSLWPPNHRFWTITAHITVSDVCDGAPVVRLVSITSNQPVDGRGDGHTSPDVRGAAFGTDDRVFELRAERRGARTRIYTITYEARDAHGNVTMRQAFVQVPGSRGH